ncbi:MAG: SH3 domain-containing protein [Candidatus Hydrogenedentes bacterium]|nr:SH3 domain-containing protein [Candidatus Hydrogenedentota bacterium]
MKPLPKRACLALCCLALIAAAKFEAGTVGPVDQAQQHPDFLAFRDSLRAAIQNKNVESLLKHVDTNVQCSHGGEEGIADFREKWKLDQNPGASPLWQELGRILALGGAFQKEQFVAPYVYAKWPESYDSFQFAAITGQNVNVRARAALDAPALKQSTYGIVRIVLDSWEAPPTQTIDGETWPWVKVGLSNGAEGYVWGKYVVSPLGYRAGFNKTNGEWKLIFLVAGD